MFQDFYLNFQKIHPEAVIPQRANSTDAGMDVYSVQDTVIPAGGDAVIPLGLKCEFPPGYSMIFKNKSGRAAKDKLGVGACVTPDTMINTNAGFYPAEELTKEFVELRKIKVMSYDRKDNVYAFQSFSGFVFVKRDTAVLEISFEDLDDTVNSINKIAVDPGHQFLDFDKGWVEASTLEVGSVINHLKVTKIEKDVDDVMSTNVNDTRNYITSNGLINHNCVIDSEYRGELMTHVFNHGSSEVVLPKGQKITQFVVVPVWCGQPTEVEDIDTNTSRGVGGFGSTGIDK